MENLNIKDKIKIIIKIKICLKLTNPETKINLRNSLL
jgi:hypothetical protein